MSRVTEHTWENKEFLFMSLDKIWNHFVSPSSDCVNIQICFLCSACFGLLMFLFLLFESCSYLYFVLMCFCLLLHQNLNKLELLTGAREKLPATNKQSWFPFHFIIQSIRLIQLGSFSVSRQATKHTYLHTHLHTHTESVLNACEAGCSRSGTHPTSSPFPSWG